MAELPRVVVTGIGLVTPLGLDVPSTWQSMMNGVSGTGRITQFDCSRFDVQVAAEVKNFVAEDLLDRRTARRSGRHTQMGVVAALEAVACTLAMQNQMLPPTINHDYKDPECDLDYVPNKPRAAKVEGAMSNAFGLGGQNSCLVFRKYK